MKRASSPGQTRGSASRSERCMEACPPRFSLTNNTAPGSTNVPPPPVWRFRRVVRRPACPVAVGFNPPDATLRPVTRPQASVSAQSFAWSGGGGLLLAVSHHDHARNRSAGAEGREAGDVATGERQRARVGGRTSGHLRTRVTRSSGGPRRVVRGERGTGGHERTEHDARRSSDTQRPTSERVLAHDVLPNPACTVW